MISPISPRAVLLDLDGTLADSLSVMRLVYGQFLERFGASATDAEFDALNGPPLREVVLRLKAAHALPEALDSLFDIYYGLLDAAYAQVSPNPGAQIFLERAEARNCIVGVVTSNAAERTRAWLARVGISQLVDFVVGGEDVLRGKPDPEPYRLAAERTGCFFSEIVAVEDTYQGARSARDAGLRTFVLSPSSLLSQLPHGVERIDSLLNLSEQLW